jgi:hypothetical protein
VILAGLRYQSNGQFNVPRWQLGAGLGTFVYMGDLTPNALGSYRTLRPALNLFVSRLLNPSFAWRINLGWGSLRGDDGKYSQPAYRQQRNFNFSTPLFELSALGEWNVLGRNDVSRGVAPYVFAGVGYSFLHIKRDWSRMNTEYFGEDVFAGLAIDAQHKPPRGLPVIPVGIGTRYYINDRFGLSAEASYRIMSTDYLDGFSRAANPGENDHFGIYSLGAVYRIGKKDRLACPVVRY